MTDTEQKTIEPEQKTAEPVNRTVVSSNGIIMSEPDKSQSSIHFRNLLMLRNLVAMEGYTEEVRRNILHIRNRSHLDAEYYDLIEDQVRRNAGHEGNPDLYQSNRGNIAWVRRIRTRRPMRP